MTSSFDRLDGEVMEYVMQFLPVSPNSAMQPICRSSEGAEYRMAPRAAPNCEQLDQSHDPGHPDIASDALPTANRLAGFNAS